MTRCSDDATWEPREPDMHKHRMPNVYYQAVRHWYGWNVGFGDVRPLLWQFTSTGLVGGQYVDCNVCRGSMDDLMKLTTRSTA